MLLFSLLLPALTSALVVVPEPRGPYGVSLIDLQFDDTSRTDPYSDNPERKIPISILTPIGPSARCQPVQQMYMPTATARYWEKAFGAAYNLPLNNTFSQIALSLCKPVLTRRQYPLILFSPGLGISRQFYNILCSNIAAQGFTVVTIDAPGQAEFITFLDGSTEYGDPNITTDAQVTSAIEVRVQDTRFILDSLSSSKFASRHQDCNLDTSSPAIFGHSLGGATALSSIIADHRFIGGANLDGAFYGAPLTRITTKPFLIFASDMPGALQHNQSTVPGWAVVWRNLLGPKWQLQIKNSTHGTFEDIPLLASLFGLYNIPGVAEILGSVDPQEALNIQVSELATLAGFLFGRKSVESVIDVANSFEEVVVVNATNVG